MPNMAPDGPLDPENKGLLSVVGDPLGQVVKVVTKPVGHFTGAIGNPTGEAALRAETVAANQVKYSDQDKPASELPGGKSIGGQAQTGQNPLGL